MRGTSVQLNWQGRLSIEDVAPLREALLAALNQHADISIDLAGVEEFDLACIQLLCSACGSVSLRGKRLTLRGADNPALAQILRVNGLNYRENCLRSRKSGCLWLKEKGE